MGYILFYSNHCIQCQKLIQYISKSKVVKKIHFICIDNRKRDEQGKIVVILENGQNMVLPPNITRVPALVLVIQHNRVLFGFEEIHHYLSNSAGDGNEGGAAPQRGGAATATPHAAAAAQTEPTPWILNSVVGCGASGFGVTSDQFSYYDTPATEYNLEKGNAGTRQMHNYVSIKANPEKIWAPEENYSPDKIGEISLEKLQQQRNADVNLPGFTPHMPPPPRT